MINGLHRRAKGRQRDGGGQRPRILIHTTFPAPYRVQLFDALSARINVQVVYENLTDKAHNRHADWYLPTTRSDVVISAGRRERRTYRKVQRSLTSFDAVLFYEYSTVSAMRLMLRCQRHDVPYLINADGGFPEGNRVKAVAKRFFIRRADGCLAGSVAASRYFQAFGADPHKIFRHDFTNLTAEEIRSAPVEATEKTRLRDTLGLPRDTVIFIAVGRLVEEKGFDVLLDSWAQLSGNVMLLIFGGGGTEEERYIAHIRAHNLDNVRIDRFSSRARLWDYYCASDAFVLPTRKDVWGLVINEAMACALPVVTTTRCIAGIELVEDGVNGFLVDVDDRAALRKALQRLRDEPLTRARMGAASLARISTLTVDEMADAQLRAVEEVVMQSIAPCPSEAE